MLGLMKTPPPRQACPGTALAPSHTASSTRMPTHVRRLPRVEYLLFIAITFLLSPSLDPVTHAPRHGDRHMGDVSQVHHEQQPLPQGVESHSASQYTQNLPYIAMARIVRTGELTYPPPALIPYPFDIPSHS